MATLGITKGLNNWFSQKNSVERFTDNAAYSSAHPDDTLVLAGPPRKCSVVGANADSTVGWNSLLAIGMLQGFQFASQRPLQPLQAIGSGRSYFVSGKSQTTWSMGRLFCNGRNLLRALYHNAVAGGVSMQSFDDSPVANDSTDMYYINLDSELFYVPFGIASVFKDKTGGRIGGVFLELCMIQSYGVGFNAGQAMIMENVNGMCDRVLPFSPASTLGSGITNRETINTVVGFLANETMGTSGTGLTDSNLGSSTQE